MPFKLLIHSLLFVSFVTRCLAEEYNLFGFAGLGYAIEIHLGHPPQKLHVLLDTGSSTLAVASVARNDITTYFDLRNSTSAYDIGDEVFAKYTEGDWSARVVTDYVSIPSVPLAPEVRADIALITNAHDFFMNGSGWQGILGLAYPAIGARGTDNTVTPWLKSLDEKAGRTMSFSVKLCGPPSPVMTTHYGKFEILDDVSKNKNHNRTFYTNILRERWFEIGILSVRVLHSKKSSPPTDAMASVILPLNETITTNVSDIIDGPIEKDCRLLNAQKSIVDCGTTNIRIPADIYKQIVGEIAEAARVANVLILNEFWYHGETACWPEPRRFSLPWLAVDILDADSDQHYFTIQYPPETYMRLMSSHSGDGTMSEYCYKLGIEPGDTAVLGAVAFEGLQVIFNKEAGKIGFQTSDCGPRTRVSGPHRAARPLSPLCHLAAPARHYAAVETKVAQWALAAALTVAMGLMLYLLAPCVRSSLVKSLRRMPTQISLSRTALVEEAA